MVPVVRASLCILLLFLAAAKPKKVYPPNFDPKLTTLCSAGRFNQVRILNGVTGEATRDWNLFDPTHAAQAGMTYTFFHDGSSDCEVFAARTP